MDTMHEAEGSGYHVPVLLQEAVDGLAIKPTGTYVDCTFGGGGHSREILRRLGPKGRLFVFDQDEDARRNIPDDPRLVFLPCNFRHLSRMLRYHEVEQVDGILADLGVSSHQFDEASRGFSIRFDAALDMRMDRRQPLTAASLLAEAREEELVRIFSTYGEVTNSRTLARMIVQSRSVSPIQTVMQFRELAAPVVKGNPNRYFAQVFQALRIAVNDEFGALEEMLGQVAEVLVPGGRIAIITFHSLEDRIVKHFFRTGVVGELPVDEIFGNKPMSAFETINRKPILPTQKEAEENPRSRSAKLRIAEKKKTDSH